MYLPRAFAETDPGALDALLERDNFITLVTVRDGVPTVSHLPVLHRRDGDRIELRGHWARPNPQAKHHDGVGGEAGELVESGANLTARPPPVAAAPRIP